MSVTRKRRVVATLAVFALAGFAAGCGSSSDSSSSGASSSGGSPGTTRVVTPVAGCDKAWTNPSDLSPTRAPARCQPGAPAPQPLPEKTKLTVAITTKAAEYQSPLLWAAEKGEFAKENIEVDIKVVPPADSLNLLAQNQIDVWFSGADAAFHNALNQGYELRWVAGNYYEQPSSKSGLWLRADESSAATVAALKGQTIGTVSGIGSVIIYPITEVLKGNGLGIKDVEFKTFAAPDVISALDNGAVPAAWLLTPAWKQVDGKPGYTFISGQPPGEPLGGIAMGTKLLVDNPQVGEAFLRAYMRTINTEFTGSYKSDAARVEAMSKLTGVPVDSMKATPELVFDWEVRQGTSARMQDVWKQTGALKYSDVIPEDKVVDRSLYEAVVGHTG